MKKQRGHVSVPAATYDRLKSAADKHGMSVSRFVEALVAPDLDKAQAVDSPPREG